MKRFLIRLLDSFNSKAQPGKNSSRITDIAATVDVTKLDAPNAETIRSAHNTFLAANKAREQNNFALSERLYREAVSAHPKFSDAQCNLGSLLKDLGRSSEAEKYLQIALRLDPTCTPASFNLAMIRIEQSRWRDAVPLLRTSAASSASPADENYWLGNALMSLGDSKAAQSAYKQVIRFDTDYVQAKWGLAMAQLPAVATTEPEHSSAPKKFDREIQGLRSWFSKKGGTKGHLAVGAQQPYYLAYIDGNHREGLTHYGALCCSLMEDWKKTALLPDLNRSPSKKIRLGIVSAHICSHSVWHAFVRGWVERLNSRDFELHIFHVGVLFDQETQFAQRKAHKLHRALGSWPVWAAAIAASKLDIIIYPEIGMDANTVKLAALRLAPVQLAAWGHPITTGLPTMDGFITASAFEPENCAQHYSERILSLPGLGCCYMPFGTKSVDVDPRLWNIHPNEFLLLCPGTPMKYAPQHDAVWVAIAQKCAPCKLVFFKRDTDDLAQMLEDRLRRAFENAGVDFDGSVRFIPWQAQSSFFGLLDRADVVLDTIGFSGFNTAMQAMERGVPMVAFEGQYLRGRFMSGILKAVGLEAWVANTVEDYIQLVEKVAANRTLRQIYKDLILSKKHLVFGDKNSIVELEKQLISMCRK